MPQENFSEKVSVNVNSSVLSSIDLLVDHGYFSNAAISSTTRSGR